MKKIDSKDLPKIIDAIPVHVPVRPVEILLERCRQLYCFDNDSAHGYVHVSRCYNVNDIDLFANRDLVFVEIYGDETAFGELARSYIAATITVVEFKLVFETECRLPIYYRL